MARERNTKITDMSQPTTLEQPPPAPSYVEAWKAERSRAAFYGHKREESPLLVRPATSSSCSGCLVLSLFALLLSSRSPLSLSLRSLEYSLVSPSYHYISN